MTLGLLSRALPHGRWGARRRTFVDFVRDRRGSYVAMLALSTPFTLLSVAAAVQYTDQTRVSERMQGIVDAAATAEVKTFQLTDDPTEAVNAAWAFLQANTDPSQYIASDFQVTAPLARDNAISARIGYFNARYTGPFTRVTGAQFMTVDVHATAELLDAGAGDGSAQASACSGVGSNWHEGLSDSGIQVNFSCARDPFWKITKLTDIAITLGGHLIELKSDLRALGSPASPVDARTASEAGDSKDLPWRGALGIDGTKYEPPPGWTGFLDNQVNALVSGSRDVDGHSDWITILYRAGPTTYRVSVTFGYAGEGQIYIKAANAGACGAPAGILGQQLDSLQEPAAVDYRIASPTTLDAPYYRTTCAARTVAGDIPHVTH